MTVQELIDELMKIEDKSLQVFGDFDPINEVEIGIFNHEDVVYINSDSDYQDEE